MNKPDFKTVVDFLSQERIAILGASRGLGLALAERLSKNTSISLWLSARSIEASLQSSHLSQKMHQISFLPIDFTHTDSAHHLADALRRFGPTRIFYCAGGGPFGSFQTKPWHAHLWAFSLNFLFPAQILHTILREHPREFTDLQQIIFVGSAIAEDKPDAGAASYSAGKHGLRGLLQSIVAEQESKRAPEGLTATSLDLRLFSPGYMDTRLLPPNSRPRQDGSLIAHPGKIADDFLQWAITPPVPNQWHRVVESFEPHK